MALVKSWVPQNDQNRCILVLWGFTLCPFVDAAIGSMFFFSNVDAHQYVDQYVINLDHILISYINYISKFCNQTCIQHFWKWFGLRDTFLVIQSICKKTLDRIFTCFAISAAIIHETQNRSFKHREYLGYSTSARHRNGSSGFTPRAALLERLMDSDFFAGKYGTLWWENYGESCGKLDVNIAGKYGTSCFSYALIGWDHGWVASYFIAGSILDNWNLGYPIGCINPQ